MVRILIVSILCLTFIVFVSGAYYIFVGKGLPISDNGSDWSTFGSYFGGVVGPIFSFLSTILLFYTIMQQSINIKNASSESLKLDMLRYVSRAEEEIEQWLRTDLASIHDNKTVQLSLIVRGVVKPQYANKDELNPCLIRLVKLTCTYTSAIALYKDNVDPYFIYKHHCEKAIDIISFLESNNSRLDPMAGPSLAICRHQLTARQTIKK
ncbi:hypothetical protein [Aeromonas salmonicida]